MLLKYTKESIIGKVIILCINVALSLNLKNEFVNLKFNSMNNYMI